MATEQTFPYQAWTLTPSLKVIERTIVGSAWGELSAFPEYRGWHKVYGGRMYHTSQLFPSRKAAIAEGRKRLETLEAKLTAATALLAKKRANLAKEDPTND